MFLSLRRTFRFPAAGVTHCTAHSAQHTARSAQRSQHTAHPREQCPIITQCTAVVARNCGQPLFVGLSRRSAISAMSGPPQLKRRACPGKAYTQYSDTERHMQRGTDRDKRETQTTEATRLRCSRLPRLPPFDRIVHHYGLQVHVKPAPKPHVPCHAERCVASRLQSSRDGWAAAWKVDWIGHGSSDGCSRPCCCVPTPSTVLLKARSSSGTSSSSKHLRTKNGVGAPLTSTLRPVGCCGRGANAPDTPYATHRKPHVSNSRRYRAARARGYWNTRCQKL